MNADAGCSKTNGLQLLRWQFASKVASLAVFAIGCFALLSWALDIELLSSLSPEPVAMLPHTALGFVLSGAALRLWHWSRTTRNPQYRQTGLGLILIFATMAAGLGFLPIAEFGLSGIGLDPRSGWADTVNSLARIAPNTAINFTLAGAALIMLRYRRYQAAQISSLVISLVALLALVGHFYAVTPFYEIGSPAGIGMPLPTAVTFLILAFALLFARADRGVIREVSSPQAGGVIARRLIPVATLLPLLIGLLVLGLYRELNLLPEVAFALRSVLEIAIFSTLVWLGARLLNQIDADRLETTEQLRQSENRFHGIFDQTFQFVALLQPDGTLIEVNRTALEFGGLALEQVIDQPFWQTNWWPATAASQLRRSIDRAAAGEFIRYEVEVQGAEATLFPIDFSLKPIFNPQAQVTLLLAEGRLVTERKRVEAELSQSEARYRAIVEDQTELICRFSPDTTILFVNEAYCRYFGLDRADLIGKSYQPIIYEADQKQVESQVCSLSRENPTVTIENRVVVDGEVRWTQWNNRMFFDQQGDWVELQAVGRDITQLKQVEADLRESEMQLKQLNEKLEQRVAERTAELAISNSLLQQEIEQRLESEKRLRRAISDAPFPILIHAEDGKILQLSKTVVEITGYAAEELATIADWTKRAYGERQNSVIAEIQRLYNLEHRIDEGEFEITTKSGTTRIWAFSSAPLGLLPDGKRLVISMASDVTERKQAELALANRLKQQAVVNQLGQDALSGVALADLFDRATALVAESLGVEFCKLLELMPDRQNLLLRSGVGWQAGLVGHTLIGTDLDSQAGYTLQQQKPVIVEDLRTETRFHGPSLLLSHGVVSGLSTLIQGRNDVPFGVLGAHSSQRQHFTQDDANFLQAVANLLAEAIDRKRAEQEIQQLNATLEQRVQERTRQLEASNQELEAFSYSVAHDLRAPLRAIQGFAQALTEDYHAELDELAQEYIQRMSLAAEYLDTLIQDLLTYSRLRQAEILLQRVSLVAVLESALADLEPEIAERQAQITVADNLPIVKAQRTILKQIIINLITNALKFTAPGVQPAIQIGVTELAAAKDETEQPLSSTPPSWIRLWVADNGIGIAPQHQTRIFNTFERLHGVESYPGTGIGLAIVKRGSERLGGRAGVESSLNHGSRFWVDLQPAASDTATTD